MGFSLSSVVGGITGGDIFGAGMDYINAKKNREAQEAMQQRQIDWERERAKNAHQWEVEDLTKAGLNPILSAGGSGAQTGGISAPTIDTSGYSKMGDRIQTALTRAIDAKRQQKEAELADSEIQQKGVQNSFIAAQTLTEAYRQGLISKQTASEATKAQLAGVQTKQLEQLIWQEKAKFEFTLNDLQAKIDLAKAEKRNTDAKTLQEEYNATKRKLTYWNNQINIATKSVQNIATSAAAVAGAFNPGHFLGNMLKSLKNEKPKGYTRY